MSADAIDDNLADRINELPALSKCHCAHFAFNVGTVLSAAYGSGFARQYHGYGALASDIRAIRQKCPDNDKGLPLSSVHCLYSPSSSFSDAELCTTSSDSSDMVSSPYSFSKSASKSSGLSDSLGRLSM